MTDASSIPLKMLVALPSSAQSRRLGCSVDKRQPRLGTTKAQWNPRDHHVAERNDVERLRAHVARHGADEQLAYPAAAALLDDGARDAMGAEMRRRRGAAS